MPSGTHLPTASKSAACATTICGELPPPCRRGVQHFNVFPRLDGSENVMLASYAAVVHNEGCVEGVKRPRQHTVRATDAEASGLLAKVGCRKQMGRPIRANYGGQQQRVAIARFAGDCGSDRCCLTMRITRHAHGSRVSTGLCAWSNRLGREG